MSFLKSLVVAVMLSTFPAIAADSAVESQSVEATEITVNINTANVEQLSTLLNGIGEGKAKRIIAYREEHGDFLTADDLAKVKGIGPSTVAKNRERIVLQ